MSQSMCLSIFASHGQETGFEMMCCGVGQRICWNNILMHVSHRSTENVNSRQIKKAAELTANAHSSSFFFFFNIFGSRHKSSELRNQKTSII
jgi:hypothetical protein